MDAAASSIASFRVATTAIEAKRRERPVSKSVRVSSQRKLLITMDRITLNGKRQTSNESDFDPKRLLNHACLWNFDDAAGPSILRNTCSATRGSDRRS